MYKRITLIFILSAAVACLFYYGFKFIKKYNEIKCLGCNVLFIDIDTLSAQHLPCYGYPRNTAPNLCSFAKENIFFENAYANSDWTLPSELSLLSGLIPEKTGVTAVDDKLNPEVSLIPQYLKEFGYESKFIVPTEDVAFPLTGVYGKLGDSIINNNILDWEESLQLFKNYVKSGNKTFMFLHSYDNHAPYFIGNNEQIYPPLNTKFPQNRYQFPKDEQINDEIINRILLSSKKLIDSDPWWINDDSGKLFKDLVNPANSKERNIDLIIKIRDAGLFGDRQFNDDYMNLINKNDPEEAKMLEALYDQTINIMDSQRIPLITNFLNDPLIKNNTVVVIFSSHGEEFMEHGHISHETMYNSNVKVPLIMYIPGIKKTVITTNTQLADVVPTVNQIIGVDTKTRYDGRSLVYNLLGLPTSEKLIEIDDWKFEGKSLVYGEWKLFLKKDSAGELLPYELYNLKQDPGETQNILPANTKIAEMLVKKMSN